MPLRLDGKKEIVREVSDIASQACSLVTAEYDGMTVKQMTALREAGRNSGVYVKVVRNTLAKKAVESSNFKCVQPELSGALLLAFSRNEPSSGAKLIREYSKKYDALRPKTLVVNGCLFDASSLDYVANLPTKEVAISQLLSVMMAPISTFVRTLSEPTAKTVRTFQAVADKKGG